MASSNPNSDCPSNKLRYAILGSGYMGRTYAECIARHNSRASLVAVSGGSRAPKLAADYGVDYVEDYESLLGRSDVDAVLVATPHVAHHGQVVKAASRGKHVLVEKPMAISVAECDSMIEACRRANVYLEVIQTLRFRGAVARGLSMIREGRLGTVRMVRGTSVFTDYESDKAWTYAPENGGAILDMGVHNFDIIKNFVESRPTSVFSTIKSFSPGATFDNLSAMTQFTFENGAIAQQWMSFELPKPGVPDSLHRYLVVGDKAMLDIDGYGKLQLGSGDKWETVWVQPPIDYVNKPLDPVRLEAFFTQTQAFAEDVLDRRKPLVPGEEGRAAVEMVEAARISSKTGNAVRLPLTKHQV